MLSSDSESLDDDLLSFLFISMRPVVCYRPYMMIVFLNLLFFQTQKNGRRIEVC